LSKGRQPCIEKQTRGGIWRYNANASEPTILGRRTYASGIRNGEGIAIDSDGWLFVTQHGRDQLYQD